MSKKPQKKKITVTKVKVKKRGDTALKMYCVSFIILIAVVIWAYVYQQWIILFISGGLMFFTLLFYAFIKHAKQRKIPKIEKKPEVKPEIKKSVTTITKLVEKEISLDIIKLKRKVVLYLILFLFGIVPVFLGYTLTNWITLSLGVLLAIISIFGLFWTITKLKKITKKVQYEPKEAEKSILAKQEVHLVKKPEKSVSSDKKQIFKKIRFIAGIILILAVINGIIFYVPSHLWLYLGIGLGLALVLFIFFFSMKKKQKQKVVTTKEVEKKESAVVDEDIQKVLKITDELLGNLPDELIHKFAKSKDFELYERVLNKYNIK